jgi:hypothetical protein
VAQETEPESSERPRGRPRREPPTDHDLGSSRSSRDDDVPQSTVGVEVTPQMYDDAVLHTSKEAVPHTSEEGAEGSTSSVALKPYLRGPAKLPK